MAQASVTQTDEAGRERLGPFVDPQTAEWLRVQTAIRRITQGEIIDELVTAEMRRRGELPSVPKQ